MKEFMFKNDLILHHDLKLPIEYFCNFGGTEN